MIVVKAEVLMSALMLSVGDSFIQIFENLKISQAARLWMTFFWEGENIMTYLPGTVLESSVHIPVCKALVESYGFL